MRRTGRVAISWVMLLARQYNASQAWRPALRFDSGGAVEHHLPADDRVDHVRGRNFVLRLAISWVMLLARQYNASQAWRPALRFDSGGAVEHHLPADDRVDHVRGRNFVLRDRHDVAREHRDIGQLAGLERAFELLLDRKSVV